MRKLKLFFACLLMAVLSIGQVWAVTITPGGTGWTTTGESQSATVEGVTLATTKGLDSGTGGQIRIYKDQTFTISSSSAITSITFTCSESGTTKYGPGCFGALDGYTYSGTNGSWTGSATSVTFTASSNQVRILTLEVTLASGGGSVPVTGVSLNKSETSIAVGETETLTATIEPGNATVKTVSWSSSDKSVATVDGGVVTAVAEGTATITVASTEDATKKATCAVTVTAAPAASNWQVIAPENLATGDVVVLTMNVGGTYYAAANNNGTSNPPSATSVAVTGSNLSATPATTLQWTVTVVSEGVFQFSVGDNKLYCTDTNNGVRVGDPTSGTFCNTFDIATENSKFYLHATTLTRYLGIYNSQDWRCYGSVNNNIKNGSLVIFKENDNREAAGLEFATKQYLIKKNAEFTAPTLVNPNSLPVTYLSSNTDVAEVAANGAITIKTDATGAATITASFGGDETYKDGSASYTIFVAEKAGTNVEGEILTEAIAKELIDLGCTLDVYVTGTILTPQYYDQSKTYTVTLTDGFQFYYFYAGPNETTFDEDILTAGDVLVAYGNLKKSGNNYRLNPCYMVSREPYSEPKVDISNTEATAYTPAQAIALYNDVTSDLTKTVYVKGVVVASPAIKYNSELTDAAAVYNGTYNVYVKAENDDSENPTKFEFFRMYADENNSTFEEGDIQVGDVIVAKGILSKYNNTYEFAQGCQMVSKKSKATMTFDDLDLVVDDVETLAPKTITLAQASAILYTIKEGSDDCVTISGAQITATAEGSATIVATLATTDDYIGTSVEFAVTVTTAPVVLTDYYEKVTSGTVAEGTYLIVYEDASVAFNGGLATLDAESNTIAVDITSDNKIGVTSATEAATFYIDPTAGTIQAKSGKYIGVTSNSNGLKTSDDADAYSHTFSIDNDGNAVIAAVFDQSTMSLRYNAASNQARFRYYKDNGQQAIQLYKLANEAIKPAAGLAWDPAEDIELTVGGDFTAPALLNPNNIDAAEITITSSNTNVATVTNGVVALVAEATGTTTITATFAGNDDFKPATVSYKITVNPAYSIYVQPSLNVNFGSVEQDAEVADKKVTVTFTNVPAATLTLEGAGASAFTISPAAAMTASGDITISASSANVGTFAATLTISDDANNAESKVVNISITVNEPVVAETAVATDSKWVPATEIVNGMQVLIVGERNEKIYAVGAQTSNNRTAVEGSLSEGVFTPGENTMAFTVVAQEGGTYALQASNGKYLYAAGSGSGKNYLRSQDGVDDNAKWTLSVSSATANGTNTNNKLQLNNSSDIFSCYSSTQKAIALYVPKPVVTYVAKIGETMYESLPAAVAAAQDGQTVELLMDVAAGPGVMITTAEHKQIIIDFGNHTYCANSPAVGSAGTQNQAFHFEKGCNITLQNGTITSSGDEIIMLIQNYGDLTLMNITLIGNNLPGTHRYVLSNNCGNVVIGAGTTITAKEGDVAFDVCVTNYYPEGTQVTVEDGATITGIVEYDVWGTIPADNKATLTIEGGNFNITWNVEPALAEDAKDNINVEGGTFTAPVPNDYCAEGFVPKDNGNGQYGVHYAGYYERGSLTPGNYATICLPNGGKISGASLFDIEYYENSTLYLLEVEGNAMVAGRPYIFLPSSDKIKVIYTDIVGAEAGTYNGLVGSLSLVAEEITANAGNYILYNNQYWYVNSLAYVGANRAYIHMDGVPTQPSQQQGAPRRRVAMQVNGQNTTTGVDNLNAGETPVKVMINGQLFILRGEKMYNANGQLVK